ncbi:hypothetical protein BV25DRAFT_1794927, partial [Artomyces pyxidatus]
EESDEDNGDETAPQRRREPARMAKKARGAVPAIAFGSPKRLVNPLPKRRKAVAQSGVSSSPGPLPPSSDVEAPSTPPRPSKLLANGAIPFTPLAAKNAAAGPLTGKQTPQTKTVVRVANKHFRIKIAIDDAFPVDAIVVQWAKASFLEACNEVGAPRRAARFHHDQIYVDLMVGIIKRCVSQIRGEVKTKAQAIVPSHFGFADKPATEVAAIVAKLTDRSAFYFEDPEKRKGLFLNSIIPKIMAAQWFARKSAEGCGIYASHFNPASVEFIAFAITTAQCVLGDWVQGVSAPSTNDFTHDEYDPIYRKHIKSLNKFRNKKPAAFAKLQTHIWSEAW